MWKITSKLQLNIFVTLTTFITLLNKSILYIYSNTSGQYLMNPKYFAFFFSGCQNRRWKWGEYRFQSFQTWYSKRQFYNNRNQQQCPTCISLKLITNYQVSMTDVPDWFKNLVKLYINMALTTENSSTQAISATNHT